MGGIKYLHLNSLLILDESLVSMPEKTFTELAHRVVLRNSTLNEALHYEILRSLDSNLTDLDAQLHSLATNLLAYLDSVAYSQSD
jgi:hypothetical protein